MKAVNVLGGQRAWLAAMGVAIFLAALALLMGGCGGSDNTSASQEDISSQDEFSLAENSLPVGPPIDNSAGAGGDVLPGYTASQCVEEMTARYGDADTAGRVCEAIRAGYGGFAAGPEELANVLPAVEMSLDVTPLPDAPVYAGDGDAGVVPGDSGYQDGGDTYDVPPGSDDTSSEPDGGGWGGSGGIEIVVPPSP